ncbi:hypothetical protein ANO11243_065850 [Dothideomycetidae sp. 11243]|nr:hypothetical protein ANO11243_065850 [fungal sp. No.11243]
MAFSPTALAQSCISLSDSTQCPAFNASSVSTNSAVSALFPFLASVTDTASFDNGLQNYVSGSFIQQRFQQLIGCGSFNASDPTEYYARYTTSVICNAIIQNSVGTCGLTGQASAPLCADTCALYAQNEQNIASGSACGTEGSNAASQIRADLTNCQIPAQALQETCISGAMNQPQNCGFDTNMAGLCSYCGAGSPNATDSCCVFSNTESLCKDVHLPISSATATAATSPSVTSSQSSSPTAASLHTATRGLSGGQIAGLVVGTLLGVALILALLILACVMVRRRRADSRPTSIFNQPSPQRKMTSMASVQHDEFGARVAPEKAEALPGGRVTRMSAIDGGHDEFVALPNSDSRYNTSSDLGSPMLHQTPKGPPPLRGKRSNFTGDALAYDSSEESSPPEALSSPEGTGQSEQLAFFKDYYSHHEVHTGDLVSTLWAYQPRAQDEFELERGDMLKVVGIWDDGWATGVRVRMRADRWNESNQSHRDSGVDQDEEADDEVKAFPLVCVCLPRFWKQTIEGETTDGIDSGGS